MGILFCLLGNKNRIQKAVKDSLLDWKSLCCFSGLSDNRTFPQSDFFSFFFKTTQRLTFLNKAVFVFRYFHLMLHFSESKNCFLCKRVFFFRYYFRLIKCAKFSFTVLFNQAISFIFFIYNRMYFILNLILLSLIFYFNKKKQDQDAGQKNLVLLVWYMSNYLTTTRSSRRASELFNCLSVCFWRNMLDILV